MRFKKSAPVILTLAAVGIAGLAVAAAARPGTSADGGSAMCGHGMGPGAGQGMSPGHGMGPGAGPDMMGIHFLFAHRDEIRRTVKPIPGGVRTTTESDDPAVATQLRAHVRAMYARLKEHRPINARDPLFAALFRNADKIDARIDNTPKGVTVTETSSDPEVAALIRKHADVVGQFIANGMHEMMRSH
jgi:hypothetical protein